MNKIITGGLAATLAFGGLGLATGPAQAAPTPTTTNGVSAAASPLNLCDLLPTLCGPGAPVTGPLLAGVDGALDDLFGLAPGAPTAPSADGLVDAITEALAGVPLGDQQAVANAIASQLAGAGLSPAALTQVLSGLSGSGLPAGALTTLVGNLVTTVQDLVTGLLGLGGGTPDPAQVQALVTQILDALASGDTAALQSLLSGLLSSLPGGAGLDPSVLTGLVNQLLGFLQSAGSPNRPSPSGVINRVDAAVNPAPVIRSVRYFTNVRPTIRGTGAAGAAVVVRTTGGTVLAKGTVNSAGSFTVKSRKLKLKAYAVTATQTPPGRVASGRSASVTFRVVSAKPVIKTASKKKFKSHRPKINGIGFPGSKITLRSSSNKKLGSVKVRSNGTWTIKSRSLSSGTKKIKAVQTGHGKKKTTKVRIIRIR